MTDLTEGNDVLVLDLTQNSTINALGGNDTLTIIGVADRYSEEELPLYSITVNGGAGDDRIIIQGYVSSATIDGGAGHDFISFVEDDTDRPGIAYGGDGNDTILGIEGVGGAGNDYLGHGGDGGDGNDTIYGGDYGGSYGGAGSDMIFDATISDGGAGDDFIWGGEVISGGDGSDYLLGGYYAYGGAGNDIMLSSFADGGAGRDVWFGLYPDLNAGADGDKIVLTDGYRLVSSFSGVAHEFILTPEGAAIDEDGDGVADWVYEHPGLSATDFLAEGFDGDPLANVNDTFTGTAAAEYIHGGGGNDDLSGGGGLDFLFGGFGHDVLSGNAGDDLLVGQAGDDRLYGGSGADELDGGDGNDTLSGSAGDDFAYGGAGNDVIAGGDGNDRLLGEGGDDRINGGDGNDTIVGGEGRDVLTGGAGADRFIFAAADSKAGASLRDVITDFETGIDKLDITVLHITNYAAQIGFQSTGSGLIVYADLGGNGFDSSDFAVQLTGVTALAQSDFILS